jgi:hypothetical protein
MGHAQSPYQLFRPGVQYLYSHQLPVSDFTSPLLGIQVGEEECHIMYESLQPNIPANDPECLVRVPAFIGSEVCQTATATTLNLGSDEDPLLLTLFPEHPVGSTWLAVVTPADSVYAKVDQVTWTSVLGLPDSVKTINLYTIENGDLLPLYNTAPIRISRNYGLVTGVFLHWLGTPTGPIELVGMSDPVVGVQNPNREQVFQLTAGDELHVTKVTTQFVDDSFYHEYREKQNTYTSTGLLPGGDRFFVFRGDQKIYQDGPAASTDTIRLTDQTDTLVVPWPRLAFLDEQPGALLTSPDYPESWQVVSLGHQYFCEQPAKRLGAPVFMSNEECAVILFDVLPGDDFYAYYSGPYYRSITVGGFHFRLLEYANVAGQPSCGTPFDFVVNTEEVLEAEQIVLWPNPVRHQLNISWFSDLSLDRSLEITNSVGQIVHQTFFSSNHQNLDLSSLPEGNYYLHFLTPNGQTTIRKLIKQ